MTTTASFVPQRRNGGFPRLAHPPPFRPPRGGRERKRRVGRDKSVGVQSLGRALEGWKGRARNSRVRVCRAIKAFGNYRHFPSTLPILFEEADNYG